LVLLALARRLGLSGSQLLYQLRGESTAPSSAPASSPHMSAPPASPTGTV